MDISKLQNKNGYIKISAMDHRDSLRKLLPESVSLSDFKNLLTQTFAPYSTGVLVDPEYGHDAIQSAKNLGLGLMLTREKTGYVDNPDGRITELYEEFDSKKLKEMGADAIKILLYYNSKSANKNAQLDVIKKVREETLKENLPFLIEPITYEIPGVTYNKGEEIIEAVKDLTNLCEILKLEFPVSPEDSENFLEDSETTLKGIESTINIPWVLLSRGMKFDNYKKALLLSKKYNCSGFAVGRAVWQEASDQSNFETIKEFIESTATSRMKELSEIYE